MEWNLFLACQKGLSWPLRNSNFKTRTTFQIFCNARSAPWPVQFHICFPRRPVQVSCRITISATSFSLVNHCSFFLVSPFSFFNQRAIRLCRPFFRQPPLFHLLVIHPNRCSPGSLPSLHRYPCRMSFLFQHFPDLLYLTPSPLPIISDTSSSSAHCSCLFFSTPLSLFLCSSPFGSANLIFDLHRCSIRSVSTLTSIVSNRHADYIIFLVGPLFLLYFSPIYPILPPLIITYHHIWQVFLLVRPLIFSSSPVLNFFVSSQFGSLIVLLDVHRHLLNSYDISLTVLYYHLLLLSLLSAFVLLLQFVSIHRLVDFAISFL